MESPAADKIQAIQKTLEPYVRPRDEAAHIRRLLALNLRSCYENGPQQGPLALADSGCTLKSPPDARGLQRDYLEALHANIKAQREYESVSQTQPAMDTQSSASARGLHDAGRLEQYVATIKLKKRQDRLKTVEKYLDLLGEKPAASPEFSLPESIFKGSVRLPDVPKTVVSSFTVDDSSVETALKTLVDRLEKAVLLSKLLLKKEEQCLKEAKSCSTASPDKVSDSAKLAALSATKNELIVWMEAELGKAGPGDENTEAEQLGDSERGETKPVKSTIEEQVSMIKEKYASYVAAREEVVQLIAQIPQTSIPSPRKTLQSGQLDKASLTPDTHLITPYIAKLLATSHEQKSSLAQKAQLSTLLAKQTEDSTRNLHRLAEESQILPDNFIQRRNDDLDSKAFDRVGRETTSRVQPWVFAADNAKLATLETVAEKVEEGQIALENATKFISGIAQLLGRTDGQGDDEGDEDTTEDIWLAETQSPPKVKGTSITAKNGPGRAANDVWMTLDGNLGLIDAEDSRRR